MCGSCHIQSVKYWSQILTFESMFSFNFHLKKKLRLNFAFWDTFNSMKVLHAIKMPFKNSKEIRPQSSIRVICTSFRSDFFSAEN
jgi:hypothetical protein